ncbi:MAG: insulinase family protein [Nitrososphaerota archaeon]|jgi:predicted Zn-dependent peptidase|nr:insulinase family protein [Candidatus Termitimicrobium sp.]MDR0493560.1 insulinase family protein [Nitrososphaerota archaeon]
MSDSLVWQRMVLPNGLTVLLYPRKQANTAQLALAVRYGSNQEPPEFAGMAHFIEHMLAGGSEQRIGLSRSIENFGGVMDLYTDREQVTGVVDVLPEKLVDAAGILSELFFGDAFEKSKFEMEQKIILNELSEVADAPTIKVEELLLENLFLHHPIRRPIGGYPKIIKQLTLPQLTQEHKANYGPQNMMMVLSGKFNKKTLDIILEDFTNNEKTGKISASQVACENDKPKALVVEEKAGITQSYLSIGAKTINATHRDAPVLDLIGTLLGGGTSSRLFIELREKQAVTYDVNSAHCKGSDFGYLSVNCAVNTQKTTKAQKLVLKELEKLQSTLVPLEELERVKQIMLGGILRGMDDSHDTLEIISYMEAQFGNEFGLQEYVAKIQTVTNQDIQKAATQYLNDANLGIAVLKPMKHSD